MIVHKPLVFSVLFFSFVLIVLSFVLYSNYVKVADYVCYYGVNPYDGMMNSYVRSDQDTLNVNGSLVNYKNTLTCVRNNKSFSCPVDFERGEFLGYEYTEKDTIKGFVT